MGCSRPPTLLEGHVTNPVSGKGQGEEDQKVIEPNDTLFMADTGMSSRGIIIQKDHRLDRAITRLFRAIRKDLL